MTENINRRNFLKKSAIVSAGAALGFSFEEKALLAKDKKTPALKIPQGSLKAIPKGKIKNLDISRVICGGNLIGGWAHSRDLIYVSELVKSYHTDEKVFETLALAEENGVNTIITNPSAARVLNRYWNERGGKIQWISEGHPSPKDIKTGIQKTIDKGASSVYIQGGVADRWVKRGLIDELGGLSEAVLRAKHALDLDADADVALIPYPEAGTLAQQLTDTWRRISLEVVQDSPLKDLAERVQIWFDATPVGAPVLVPPFVFDIR